jgi:4-oxalocrotonate tautomerase
MPLIQVTLVEGRPPELVRRLLAELTEAAVQALDAPPESVRVIVSEVPARHWAVGGVPKSEAGERT